MTREYSDAQYADVKVPLEFGHLHTVARQTIPFALGAIAIGLLVMTSLDGRDVQGKHALGGLALVVGAVVFVGLAVWRRTQANVASVVIAPSGITFRDISEKPIPWREIRNVDFAKVSHSKDLTRTRVVKLEVSQSFYSNYTGDRWLDDVIGESGEPSALYLSYYHTLPVEAVHDAIQRRWQYYSRDARDADAQTAQSEPDRATAVAQPVPQRASAIQRAGSMSLAGVFASMFKEQTLAERIGSLAALVAIGGILSNLLGIWSTEKQIRGRAEQAEWRAQNAKYEADEKAWAEERRKSDAKWEAIKKCMGRMVTTANADADCLSKIK